jgi:signal transduction histidine kinase
MTRLTLRVRLFVSYALVVAVGAAVMAVVIEIVGRQLFDQHMSGLGYGRGGHAGAGMAQVQSAFGSTLTRALLVALAASLAAAILAAFLVARRLLRPIDAIRAATHRLAAGQYGEVLAEPGEPELAALVRDVNSLADILRATERRRAALIGDVAHEMRTPLTTLKGYADGLQDGLFTIGEILPGIGQELTRLERLAADLAAVSRSEESGPDLHLVDDDLGDIARSVTERLLPQYRDRRVELLVTGEGPVTVTVDRERIVQALTNLVGNALTYTPTGGTVRVAVTTRPDGTAAVSISDTGIGLAPDDADRVFERFFRVDPHRHTGGSGVGLTIARAIARAHGGNITVTSPGPGKGSTFELVLPRRTVPAAS